MALACVICNTTSNTLFCQHCAVYIPQFVDEFYKGEIKLHCYHCHELVSGRDNKCVSCHRDININSPPLDKDADYHYQDTVGEGILKDPVLLKQTLTMLGLEEMDLTAQGVTMIGLAAERMNAFSSDYNLNEVKYLTTIGMKLCEQSDEAWAINLAHTRYAEVLIHMGEVMKASTLLHSTYLNHPGETVIEQIRKMQVLADFALANRLAGNSYIANIAIDRCYKDLQNIFPLLSGESRRIDLIASIISTLADEGIVHGKFGENPISDEALDRLLELDNMMDILAKMEDPVIYIPQFKVYLRLISALYWYGEVLITNNSAKRQVLIENCYDRLLQWLEFVPVSHLLKLRISKLIEVFTRSDEWSTRILADNLKRILLEKSSKDERMQVHYMIAEAEANVGKLDLALGNLQIILKSDEVDDTLRPLSERLKWRIELETIGIVMGKFTYSKGINLPVSIQLEEVKDIVEPYLKDEYKNPVLRLSFEEINLSQSIAIFGDYLIKQVDEVNEIITKVGDKSFDDKRWQTPHQKKQQIEGARMDIVVITFQSVKDEEVYLLFESKEQTVRLENEAPIFLDPPPLIILKGIITQKVFEEHEIMQFLIEIMTGELDINIYTLRK